MLTETNGYSIATETNMRRTNPAKYHIYYHIFFVTFQYIFYSSYSLTKQNTRECAVLGAEVLNT